MTSILEHWQQQNQLEKGNTDNKILEEINLKLRFLTPRELDHLSNEIGLIWLESWNQGKG
jgi:hypothetical protein